MDQEAPAKPKGHKVLQVTSQRTRWDILLVLCLLHGSSMSPPTRRPHSRWLQAGSFPSRTHLCTASNTSSPCRWPEGSFEAASTLRGPKLVSGETGGSVTIQCRYVPSSVNRHQRKYWCRMEPPLWICRTIVSTNHYIHHDYRGRVVLTDFPHSGLFVVRLFRLSLGDMGHYRCGIGDRNNMLFFSMTLTVLAGPTINATSSAPGEFITASFGIASPAANKGTSGATQFMEGSGSEWDRITPTTGTSKITPSIQERQTPGTAKATVLGTSSRDEGPVKATVPTPESPASEPRNAPTTPEGIWIWGTRSSTTVTASTSEGRREKTTSEAERLQEETEVGTSPDTARKTAASTSPSPLMSEHVAWDTFPEGTVVSKQPALYSMEELSLTPGARAWNTTHVEVVSVEESADESLENTPEENSPPGQPSQPPTAGPAWVPGNGSSMKSVLPGKESNSWILTPVSTVLALVLLVALVLLQRRIWRKRTSLEAERAPKVTLIQMTNFLEPTLLPDQLPDVEKNLTTQASLTVPDKDPGP